MTKLTDEEIGRLLRETFADKEELTDSLPEATKARRRVGPILVAAASVAVVLGGILYAVDAANRPGPGQAQATTTIPAPSAPASHGVSVLPDDQLIWGAALKAILAFERPAGGWPGVRVLDAVHQGDVGAVPTRGRPFTEQEKAGIESALTGDGPVQWVRTRQTLGPTVCEQPAADQPYVTLGPIVHKGGHVEVAVSVWRSCLDARQLTYRLDQKAGHWQVTGTVGPQAVS